LANTLLVVFSLDEKHYMGPILTFRTKYRCKGLTVMIPAVAVSSQKRETGLSWSDIFQVQAYIHVGFLDA
jgi:hypothetical protein